MSIINEIKKSIDTNSQKKAYFVRWYVDSDKSKDSYDKDCKNLTATNYETVMKEWLMQEDVQEAIKQYLKLQRNIKMMEIYDAMYDKAIKKGDVNSAKWCETFFKSDFFENEEDEIDNYLDGVDIPALQK